MDILTTKELREAIRRNRAGIYVAMMAGDCCYSVRVTKACALAYCRYHDDTFGSHAAYSGQQVLGFIDAVDGVLHIGGC